MPRDRGPERLPQQKGTVTPAPPPPPEPPPPERPLRASPPAALVEEIPESATAREPEQLSLEALLRPAGKVPPPGDPAALHRERFLSHLPPGEVGEAWQATWHEEPAGGDARTVSLPYPYLSGEDGLLHLASTPAIVQGLHAIGAHETARGMLEDWLALGERYTGLPATNRLADFGRSAMPRLSGLFLEEAEANPDPDFLPRAYRVLAEDYLHVWSDPYFKLTPTGLNRFTDVDYSHEETLIESGGQKNKVRFGGDPADYAPVDLNAWLYRTEKDLEAMARRMEERAAARGDAAEAREWAHRAEQWSGRAAVRKARILDKLWVPEKGFFLDYDLDNRRYSRNMSLAAYSILAAGVLDPRDPREKAMVEAMVERLDSFVAPGQSLPSWDHPGTNPEAQEPADPEDLLVVVAGLERYGYHEKAAKLREGLRQRLETQKVKPDPRLLGVRALLEAPPASPPSAPPDEPTRELGGLMSPGALQALGVLAEGEAAVRPSQAGRLERRLKEIHPSLLQPDILRDLRRRGLFQQVYRVSGEGGEWRVVSPSAPVPEAGGERLSAGQVFEVGGVRLVASTPGAVVHRLRSGAAVLSAGGLTLPLVRSGDHLIVGDRAYPLAELPREIRLPRDILASFYLAGDNPTLERFYDRNREWLGANGPDGNASRMGELPGRPGWKGLFDRVAGNWRELTLDPPVVPQNSQVQYFNRAAVPSLGIFKTQFNWDTYFMARGMQLQGQGRTVAGMADNLLYLLKHNGRVPNAARSLYLNKSQPPLLPHLVRLAEPLRRREFGEEATERWLSQAYELLARDYRDFWNEPGGRGIPSIDGKTVRLSRYGGPNSKFAMDESGFDTTSRFKGRALDMVPADLNALLWLYARDMEDLSGRLQHAAESRGDLEEAHRYRMDAQYWKAEADRRKQDLIQFCWDEEDGMFRDYLFQGPARGLVKDQDSLSPTVAPLWVGMLDPHHPRERRMIERSLDNLARFEKEHGLAAMAEDYGHPEMQWNGPSGWAPLHMMAVESLVRYGRIEDAARITGKWLDLIQKVYERDGVILERYDVVRGDHPPVQKGRYEETQGAGPGFGWTNASIPWALVEVVGGARLQRESGGGTRLVVAPAIPPALAGQEISLEFRNPSGRGVWTLRHRYDPEAGTYRARLEGGFDTLAGLEVVTPPLPPGLVPEISRGAEYTIREEPAGEGRVRYRVRFASPDSARALEVRFGAFRPAGP